MPVFETAEQMWEHERTQKYGVLRGNMLCAKVEEHPAQGALATIWIERHSVRVVPNKVTYNIGPKFGGPFTVSPGEDGKYVHKTTYYGPMLVQAVLEFDDDLHALQYVYCYMPEQVPV